jgi:hypothetical protein
MGTLQKGRTGAWESPTVHLDDGITTTTITKGFFSSFASSLIGKILTKETMEERGVWVKEETRSYRVQMQSILAQNPERVA